MHPRFACAPTHTLVLALALAQVKLRGTIERDVDELKNLQEQPYKKCVWGRGLCMCG